MKNEVTAHTHENWLNLAQVTIGVPRGSALSPFLIFIVILNDLLSNARRNNVETVFAVFSMTMFLNVIIMLSKEELKSS